MPLFIDGLSLKSFSSGEVIYKNAIKQEDLAARTAALAMSPVKEFPEGSSLLYAGEKEVCTAVSSTSRFEWIATDDGTTCVMAAVWQKGNPSYSGIAHIDSKSSAASLENELIAPLAKMSKSDEPIEVIIAGGCWSSGFQETCSTSVKMVYYVLENLNKSKSDLHLRTLLVLKKNPADELPLCMGLALNTRTGEARRARCVTHGPLFPVRYLYLISSDPKSKLCSVYDQQKDLYAIAPPKGKRIITYEGATRAARLSDSDIRNRSTSPECETPRFESDFRSAIDIVISGTLGSYFPGGNTAYFDEKGNKI